MSHILYAIALPYVLGARTQLGRYRAAALTLKDHPVSGTYQCLHEASCLFEDLSTVGKYTNMCGQHHELNGLWLDVRNHIRHDVREEFDKEDSKQKNGRAKRLGLNDNLQTCIGFDANTIKVGSVTIELDSAEEYLSWAEGVINESLEEAKSKGWVK